MLSRLAESIFWMERYRERAENTARLIDVNLNLNLDLPQDSARQWAPTVHAAGDWDLFESKYPKPDEKNVLEFLTFDLENPNSILSCLTRARLNAQSIRQIIPTDMWSELNTLFLFVNNVARRRRSARTAYEFYSRIKRQNNLLIGIFRLSMSHDEAWHFARMGALLERADQTSRLIDVKYFILLPGVEYVGTPYEDILWAALLKSASAFEMYRRRWGQMRPDAVLEFLVNDIAFPRSIRHCIDAVELCMMGAAGGVLNGAKAKPLERLRRLKRRMNEMRSEKIIEEGVHEYMNSLQDEISAITNSITEVFFSNQMLDPVPVASAQESQ